MIYFEEWAREWNQGMLLDNDDAARAQPWRVSGLVV